MKFAKIAEMAILIGFGMLIMAFVQARLQAQGSPAQFSCPTLPEVGVRAAIATGSPGAATPESAAMPETAATPGSTATPETAATPEGAATPGGTATPESAAMPETAAIQPAAALTSEPTSTRGTVTVLPIITLPPSSTPEPTSTTTAQVATQRPVSTGPGITPVSPPVEAEIGADVVNVRALPGMNRAILTTLALGAPVAIVELQQADGQTWAHVTFTLNGRVMDGWIFGDLLADPNRDGS